MRLQKIVVESSLEWTTEASMALAVLESRDYLFVLLCCRHIDFFEIVRMEDERQLAKKFETVTILNTLLYVYLNASDQR